MLSECCQMVKSHVLRYKTRLRDSLIVGGSKNRGCEKRKLEMCKSVKRHVCACSEVVIFQQLIIANFCIRLYILEIEDRKLRIRIRSISSLSV